MAKKSFWQRGEDYAEKVSEELIEQIKAGVAPWQKPWKPGEQSSPENFSTGKSYTGGNSLYLMSRGIRQGHGDNRWGTYGQIKRRAGRFAKARKGRRSCFSRIGRHEPQRTSRARCSRTRTATRSTRKSSVPIPSVNSTPCSTSSKSTDWS